MTMWLPTSPAATPPPGPRGEARSPSFWMRGARGVVGRPAVAHDREVAQAEPRDGEERPAGLRVPERRPGRSVGRASAVRRQHPRGRGGGPDPRTARRSAAGAGDGDGDGEATSSRPGAWPTATSTPSRAGAAERERGHPSYACHPSTLGRAHKPTCKSGPMTYDAAEDRYDSMDYRSTGRSGLKLPALSLGLWQNFGTDRPEETQRAILRRAFDRGVTHFDLANNYGPPYGRAEENFGRYLRDDFAPYRDELVISTKAGYDMWPGPVRPGRRQPQVRPRQPRPVAGPAGPGLRRHLLQPPLRPGDARRGDDDGARHRGPQRPGAVRRDLVVLRRQDARGGDHRPRARHPAPHPPAVVLDAQPLDRGPRTGAACSTSSRSRGWAASSSPPSPRAC